MFWHLKDELLVCPHWQKWQASSPQEPTVRLTNDDRNLVCLSLSLGLFKYSKLKNMNFITQKPNQIRFFLNETETWGCMATSTSWPLRITQLKIFYKQVKRVSVRSTYQQKRRKMWSGMKLCWCWREWLADTECVCDTASRAEAYCQSNKYWV